MTMLLLILGSSCGLSLALTPLVRRLALRYGLVDKPDGRRKVHGRVVPVAGGLAIFTSMVVVLGSAVGFIGLEGETFGGAYEQNSLIGLLLAGLVICALGVADDYGFLRGRHKLFGQFCAVLIVIGFGLVVRSVKLFDWQLDLGILAIPFTVLWLLGAINSLNLIDGMDGLLGIVGLIITAAITLMAVHMGRWEVACVATALVGALLGFLRYNFPPATIFLGDSGSMLIGLVVGTLAIQGSLKGTATIALAAPTALLTIPFFDTLAAIIRRKLTGRSIYTTDRGHLHHCMLRRGFSNRRVLLYVSCFCLLTVAGVLGSLAFEQEIIALVPAIAVVMLLIMTELFGNPEFQLVKKQVQRLIHSLVHGRRGEARQTEVRLQGTVPWAELWGELIAQASWLNLKMVRLNVDAPALQEGYHARWDSPHEDREDNRLWRADIPLTVAGHTLGRIEVLGQCDDAPAWTKVATVMKLVEEFEASALELLCPRSPVPATPPTPRSPLSSSA